MTKALAAPPPSTRSRSPSSTASTRRSGSPMSSPAFPIIRCGASPSCCRDNGVDRADRRPDRDFAACHDGIIPIREAAMRAQALAHAIPVDQVDLEALDRFLMSDRSPPDSMMLSDLDGFLTGIAVGPELVLPSVAAAGLGRRSAGICRRKRGQGRPRRHHGPLQRDSPPDRSRRIRQFLG
jgi:uncharacterized protein UPF0149